MNLPSAALTIVIGSMSCAMQKTSIACGEKLGPRFDNSSCQDVIALAIMLGSFGVRSPLELLADCSGRRGPDDYDASAKLRLALRPAIRVNWGIRNGLKPLRRREGARLRIAHQRFEVAVARLAVRALLLLDERNASTRPAIHEVDTSTTSAADANFPGVGLL